MTLNFLNGLQESHLAKSTKSLSRDSLSDAKGCRVAVG